MNACKLVGLLLLLLWGHTALYAQQVRTVRGRVQTVEAGITICQHCYFGEKRFCLYQGNNK